MLLSSAKFIVHVKKRDSLETAYLKATWPDQSSHADGAKSTRLTRENKKQRTEVREDSGPRANDGNAILKCHCCIHADDGIEMTMSILSMS